MNAVTVSLLGLVLLPIGPGPEVFPLDTRDFEIPVHLRADAAPSLKEVTLHVSSDKGKTWRKHQSIDPHSKAGFELAGFRFRAPADGHYWFKVQVCFRDGKLEPANLAAAPVEQKVLVRTNARAKSPDAELEELRETVERLEQRVEELEARKKRAAEMKRLRERLKKLDVRVKELEGE